MAIRPDHTVIRIAGDSYLAFIVNNCYETITKIVWQMEPSERTRVSSIKCAPIVCVTYDS